MLDGLGEKITDIIASVFQWLFDSILEPFLGIPSISDLIMGEVDGEDMIFRTFTQSEWSDIISPAMTAFYLLAWAIMLVYISIAASKVASSGFNPGNRSYFLTFAKDLAIVLLLVFNTDIIFELLFGINELAINGIKEGITLGELTSLDAIEEAMQDNTNPIGFLFIQLVLLTISLWGFFYYTMRKLTLALLMILSPLFVALYLNDSTKSLLGGYLRELAGTVLVQAVHVATFFMISVFASTSDNMIEQVIFFILFIPTGEALKSLFGLETQTQGKLGMAAKMTGGASMLAMGALAKSTMSGTGITESFNNMRRGKGGKSKGNTTSSGKTASGGSGGAKSGDTTSSHATSGKSNQTKPYKQEGQQSKKANRMLQGGKVGKALGKAALGTAGVVMGSALGPGGVAVGAIAGSAAGSGLGSVGGRVATAAGQGVASAGRGVAKGASTIKKGLAQAPQHAMRAGSEVKNATTSSKGQSAGKFSFQKAMKNKGQIAGSVGRATASVVGDVKNSFAQQKNEELDNKYGDIMGEPASQSPAIHALDKQRKREATAGYIGGMVGGKKGHDFATRNVAKFTEKMGGSKREARIAKQQGGSTHNQMIRNIPKTPTEIKKMAKKNENGQVAQNAIQQISTNQGSFIRVTDQNDQHHIVSKIDGGNLNLKNNEKQTTDLSETFNAPNLNESIAKAPEPITNHAIKDEMYGQTKIEKIAIKKDKQQQQTNRSNNRRKANDKARTASIF